MRMETVATRPQVSERWVVFETDGTHECACIFVDIIECAG